MAGRSLNQVTLIGNLTRDPEMKATSNGSELCRFSLALGYTYRTPDGDQMEGVDFVNIVAWGNLASIIGQYCHKGKQVMVSGKLQSSKWEQDGVQRSKLEVRATNVLLLGSAGGPAPAQDGEESKPASRSKSSKKDKQEQDEEQDYDFNQDPTSLEDAPF